MDRFDLLDRMLELKNEMLAAEQRRDWHKREELEQARRSEGVDKGI